MRALRKLLCKCDGSSWTVSLFVGLIALTLHCIIIGWGLGAGGVAPIEVWGCGFVESSCVPWGDTFKHYNVGVICRCLDGFDLLSHLHNHGNTYDIPMVLYMAASMDNTHCRNTSIYIMVIKQNVINCARFNPIQFGRHMVKTATWQFKNQIFGARRGV